ncbi:hypothetical protein [Nocardioides alcanivorans]|uniref:hypothetical protein n=1 Tax=Nocardioides alcanivorans TaxID=2897352 RepID=UPI001F4637F8|nr:hypothetical protein [Nocardioides alcanivorans]
MRFTRQQGLWTYDAPVAAPPLAAVLEVSGAILEWTVDEPATTPRITLTDVEAADWLWRLVGTDAHVELVEAATGSVEATVDREVLEPLRRLALGHWMRRWWPASARDGIAALEPSVLDAELAVLTAAAEEFLAEATFDSDVDALLAGAGAPPLHLRDDPRVVALLEACAEVGELPLTAKAPTWRADFALVAGADGRPASDAIASGVSSISWSAVPPGVFDAAEDTVTWSVAGSDEIPTEVVARVQAALADPAEGHLLVPGIAVRLQCGQLAAAGELDEGGRAMLPLRLAESAAWNLDWASTQVHIGAAAGESREARQRVRRFVRSRQAAPPPDAFLAELLALDADY